MGEAYVGGIGEDDDEEEKEEEETPAAHCFGDLLGGFDVCRGRGIRVAIDGVLRPGEGGFSLLFTQDV